MKGSISQRAEGSWTLRFDLGYDAGGKRKQKVVTFRGTKRAADRELARLLTEFQNGTFVDPTKLTLAEYLQQWLENYAKTNVSAKTYAGYSEFIRIHLAPALGRILLAKLQPLHIQQYYTEKLATGRRDGKGGLSARTVLHHHRVLREALHQAVKWQLLGRNPADSVDPPRPDPKEPSVLDEEGISQILAEVKDTRLYLPVLLAVTTGMRRGEIVGLRWQNVDLKAGTLSVSHSLVQVKGVVEFKQPKTKKSRRVVALPDFVVEELRKHKGEQAQHRLLVGKTYRDYGLVIAQDDGTPMTPTALSQAYGKLRVRLASTVTFHGLRHTHATYLFRRNVHPKIVSERLGHSNIGITLDTYSHVLPGMQEEAARYVNDAFRAAVSA